jgi:hypothetical protein
MDASTLRPGARRKVAQAEICRLKNACGDYGH